MAIFDYSALEKTTGKEKKGVVQADTARQARQKLREQGLDVFAIAEITKPLATKDKAAHSTSLLANFFKKKDKLKVVELASISRQLSTLLNAGMPLEEGLLAVAEQSEDAKIARIVQAVRSKVMEGYTLAVGMGNFPQAFPNLYRTTISAGEKSGYLDKVLESLADYTEKQHYMRQKIQQAAIYPIMMIVVSIAIVIFLMIFVVPKMITVFQQSQQKLPLLTVGLVAFSNFLQNYGLYLLAIIGGFFWIFKRRMRNIKFRHKFHRFLLKLPLIGNSLKVVNTARFARTFGILFQAGVPVLEAMKSASQVVGMLPIKDALSVAITQVREGSGIGSALKQTGYFPAISLHLITSGESSGKLEEMLTRAANNQDQDIDSLIDSSLSLFEPLMILVMGVVVLLIVLAILVPIFQMNQFAGS